ncbi:DNA repair protein rad52 [Hypoxylon texense]
MAAITGGSDIAESVENSSPIRGTSPGLNNRAETYLTLVSAIHKTKDELKVAKDDAKVAALGIRSEFERNQVWQGNVEQWQERFEQWQENVEGFLDETAAKAEDAVAKADRTEANLGRERTWGVKRAREHQKMMFKMTVMFYLMVLFMAFILMAYFDLFALLWKVFSCDSSEADSYPVYSSTRPFHVYVDPPHDEV